MVGFLKGENGRKISTGRLLAFLIMLVWLGIAAGVALVQVRKGDTVTIVEIPWTWAASAVFFYVSRNLSPEVIQAVLLRFLGIKGDTQPGA